MRILLVNYEYPPLGGGAGAAAEHLARAFVDLGRRVLVMTSHFRGLPREEDQGGVRVLRLPAWRRRADRSNPLQMSAFLGSSLALGLPAAGRFRPDACLAFFGLPGGPLPWALKALYRIPYVVSFRGGDVPGFQKYDLAGYHRLTGPVIRRIWEGADGLVANSNGLADLARKFAPNLNIEVIPNGVDPNRFRPPAEPLDEWGPKWLFVGRLQRQKGVDTLLSALARLPRGRRGRLSVVGDGPLKPDLQRLAASLGLADDVDFMGWRSRSAMPGVYQAHQAFILPSRDEGMPNALLEAMAGGLPAIASRIAGNEELVVDGRTGFLTPVDDAESLARAMTRLADDPETARRMGRAARERAVGRYSWTRSAEAYLNLLETAARERKSKAAWL